MRKSLLQGEEGDAKEPGADDAPRAKRLPPLKAPQVMILFLAPKT
jgi:hypothetical protein